MVEQNIVFYQRQALLGEVVLRKLDMSCIEPTTIKIQLAQTATWEGLGY